MPINSISEQGFAYSLHIAELVRYLRENEKGFPLSEQLLGCGVKAGFCSRYPEQKNLMVQHLRDVDYIIEMALHAGYLKEIQTLRIREEYALLLEQVDTAKENN